MNHLNYPQVEIRVFNQQFANTSGKKEDIQKNEPSEQKKANLDIALQNSVSRTENEKFVLPRIEETYASTVKKLANIPDKKIEEIFGFTVHNTINGTEDTRLYDPDNGFHFTSKAVTSISIETLDESDDDSTDQVMIKNSSKSRLDDDDTFLPSFYEGIANSIKRTHDIMRNSIINPCKYSYYKLYLDKYIRSRFPNVK